MASNARRLLWSVCSLCFLTVAAQAEAQTVTLVRGTGVQPPSVTKGATIHAPDVIQVPEGAIVVLEETWKSDQSGFPCKSWVIISASSYPVKSVRSVGQCPVQVKGDELARALRGEAGISRVVFYGDAKFDTPTPERVRRSHQASAPLMRDFRLASVTVQPPDSLGSRTMSALMEGQGFLGGTDYREAHVASAAACSALCGSESACVAMTFLTDKKTCYLKNALTPIAAASSMVSAVKK